MRSAMRCALVVAASAASAGAAAQPASKGPASPAPVAATASAEPADDISSAAELLARARAAEAAVDPAGALALYRAAVEAAPTRRLARHARRRMVWLEARSAAGFEPLETLMRVQRSDLSLAVLAAFEAEVPSFPDGRVKRDAWAILGDAYLEQHGEPRRALDAYQAWLASPGLPEAERELAHSKAALARAQLEGIAPSLAVLKRASLDHRAEAVLLRSQRIRQLGTPVALAVLAVFTGWGLFITRGRGFAPPNLRRAFGPSHAALALWVLGVPLVIFFAYDRRLVPQVGVVLGALLGGLILAAMVAAGRPARHRLQLSVLAVLMVLSLAFLALDRSRLLFDILWSIEQNPH